MASTPVPESTVFNLTRYPTASVRELIALAFPLILVLFSGSFMGFCDRAFLAHYSTPAFEGCVNGGYLGSLFQVPLMRITTMSQVFVGLHSGAGQRNRIGECIWQMIWFCVFSTLITLPLGMVSAPFVFGDTTIEATATEYFQTLLWFNFLFPLGATLSSFYVSQGKTKILFVTTLCAHAINIGLDYLLIFGVEGVILPMGVTGAAIATAIAQMVFCGVLFFFFLSQQNRLHFETNRYRLKWRSFWNYIQVGIPRAVARMVILLIWVTTARIMSMKNGDFLMVLTFGSTLFLLFGFINDAGCQATVTIASRLVGKKDYDSIKKLIRSAFLYVAMTMGILTIPFFFFPEVVVGVFFQETVSPQTTALLCQCCHWMWLVLLCSGINFIGFSLISATCDTAFYMLAVCASWLTFYVPVYFAINSWQCQPNIFWILASLDSLLLGIVYLIRSRQERWKSTEQKIFGSVLYKA